MNPFPALLFQFPDLFRTRRDRCCTGKKQVQCCLQRLFLRVVIVSPYPASVYVVPQLLQMTLTQHERLANVPATSCRHYRPGMLLHLRVIKNTGASGITRVTDDTGVLMAATAPASVPTACPLLSRRITGMRRVTCIITVTLITHNT